MFGRPATRKLISESKLEIRVQMPGENYASYLVDVLAQCTLADEWMGESEKIQNILKGIKEHAFNLLLRLNPTSVQKTATQCQRTQEWRNRLVAFGHQTPRHPEQRALWDLQLLLRSLWPRSAHPTYYTWIDIFKVPCDGIACFFWYERYCETLSFSSLSRLFTITSADNSRVPEARIATLVQATTFHFQHVSGGIDKHSSIKNRWRPYGNSLSCFYWGIWGNVMRNCQCRRQDQDSMNDNSSSQRFEPC